MAPGRQPDALAQRADRIEHRTGRARQRPAVEHDRSGRRPAAADEACAVGLPLDRAAQAWAVDTQYVEADDGDSSAARGRRLNSRPALCGFELGFDEQLAECRMRQIVCESAPGRFPRSW
jgi:hypothetical protein